MNKEWVELTEEERTEIRAKVQQYTAIDAIEYGRVLQYFTEQAVREKNERTN